MELAKNVNFTLRWNNKGGMESVKTLIFKRFSPNGTLVSTETIQRTEANPYFVPFTKNNSYVFEGSAIPSNTDLIGVNKLQILYVLEGETTEEILFDSSVSFVGGNQVRITEEDLTIIEITDIIKTITYTPTATDFSILKDSDTKNYYLYPGGGLVNVYSSIFDTRGPIKFLPAQDTGTTTYTSSLFYIYFPDKKGYLGKSATNRECAAGYTYKLGTKGPQMQCYDMNNCVYPESLSWSTDTEINIFNVSDTVQCKINTSLPNPYKPSKVYVDSTDRTNALKFRITNSTVPDRYRFQTMDGLFLGMDSTDTVLIDINNEKTTETMYNTINIEILQNEKWTAPYTDSRGDGPTGGGSVISDEQQAIADAWDASGFVDCSSLGYNECRTSPTCYFDTGGSDRCMFR